MLAGCWLVGGSVFFTAKWRLNTDFFLAVDWQHGWRLPSLLSWSVVGWLVLAKRLTECWLAVGWWVARCFLLQNSAYKTEGFFFSSWLTAWLAAPLFAQLVGCRSIGFGKETDRMLADCWLVGGSVFFTAKLRLKDWCFFFEQLTDCMAGGSPLCLAGRWSVDCFGKETDRILADCWLVGGSVFFYCKIQTVKLTGFFLAVDWQHGWRLPSLLSWLVVGWLVLAKRLTDCWLAVGWWVARCFLLQISA